MRPVAVRRANRDDALGISGIRDAERGIALVQAFRGLEILIAAISGGRHDDDAAVDEALALVADGGAAARVVPDVVRDGEAQVGSMNRHVAVALVDVADVLERPDDRELGFLQRWREHPEVVQLDVGTHAVRPLGPKNSVRFAERLRHPHVRREYPGHMRAVVRGGRAFVRFELDEALDELPVDRTPLCRFLGQLFESFGGLGGGELLLEGDRFASGSRRRGQEPLNALAPARRVRDVVERDDVAKTGEIEAALHARLEAFVVPELSEVSKGLVRRVDAGVDDGPHDVAAIDREQRFGGIRLDRGNRFRQRRCGAAVQRDGPHQRLLALRRHPQEHALELVCHRFDVDALHEPLHLRFERSPRRSAFLVLVSRPEDHASERRVPAARLQVLDRDVRLVVEPFEGLVARCRQLTLHELRIVDVALHRPGDSRVAPPRGHRHDEAQKLLEREPCGDDPLQVRDLRLVVARLAVLALLRLLGSRHRALEPIPELTRDGSSRVLLVRRDEKLQAFGRVPRVLDPDVAEDW